MNILFSHPIGRWMAMLAGVILAYFLPLILGGGNLLYTTFILIAVFAIAAYGMDIILSDLGEVSLGQTVFWAAGAYTTALLAIRLDWNPIASLGVALFISTVLALILGLLTVRTQQFVFSLVTYATAIVAMAVVTNMSFFGGSDGLVGMPVMQLGPYEASTSADFYPVALAFLLVVLYCVSRFRRSRLGMTARMAHLNPELAKTMGVSVGWTRVIVFTLSAPAGALAGWLYAYQRSYVGPDLLDQFFLLLFLTAVILPGRRILLGPLGAMVILVVQQQHFSFGGDIDEIVLGCILAVVLLTSKDGLAGWARAIFNRFQRAPVAS